MFNFKFASQRCAVVVGLLFALTAINTWAGGGWLAAIAGAAEGANKANEQNQKREAERLRIDQQQQLLNLQYQQFQLEKERLERTQQIERDRQAREIKEQARLDAVSRQQQVAAEKKKQQEADQKRNAISTGTGFFIAPSGYLVTNRHVIEDATNYAVRDSKGHFYQATVVASDANRDLALLKIEGNFPSLKILNSDVISKGQRVLTVGYPQISIQGNESKVTDGIISSFSGIGNDPNWFQISVPIQGGNSGGPLVTEGGVVVGVVVATANVARFFKITGNLPQNVNYAVKSKVLLDFLRAQNLQNVSSHRGKTSVDDVDASTVLVVSKNGPIDVAYSASPEQTAREERERARFAAGESRHQKEEALAVQKRLADERRTEKQRSAEADLVAKRDAAVLKAFPGWHEIKESGIFIAWLGEQDEKIGGRFNSPKASDVISLIKKYQQELPKFANRYIATTPRQRPSQQPSSISTTGQVIKDCDICPELVLIPVGSFEMGSNQGSADERPAHRVSVAGFLLGRTEITQEQWRVVMGNDPSPTNQCGDQCPVVNVSWQDAQKYAEKLGAKTGKYYRLPSEAEWEYATKAGSSTTWSFGDDEQQLSKYAWHKDNSGYMHPVAKKEPNGFGLYDMHGNVMEWTQDSWNSYRVAPTDGTAQTLNVSPYFKSWRVMRGGSWSLVPDALRSTARRWEALDYRGNSTGFRIARNLSMPDVAATAPNETEKPAGLKPETQPNPSTAMPMPVLASFTNVGSYPITECVKANSTGLTWEGKSADSEHGSRQNYTNYGDRRSGDASSYVDTVNAKHLCGYSDWRLPSKDELMSLIVKHVRQPNDYGIRLHVNRPIDDIWFPNTQASWYWTMTPFAGEAAFVWAIDFNYGDVGYLSRQTGNQVRLVR